VTGLQAAASAEAIVLSLPTSTDAFVSVDSPPERKPSSLELEWDNIPVADESINISLTRSVCLYPYKLLHVFHRIPQ